MKIEYYTNLYMKRIIQLSMYLDLKKRRNEFRNETKNAESKL